MYDFGSGVMNRVTFDGTSAGRIWTPDGQRVVFSSTSNGRRQIYAQAADGMARPELLVEEINASVGSWSSDNANLAYVRSCTEGQFDIGLFRVPDRRAGVVIGTGAAEQWPRISPDGRWLAYVSSETGRFEVYVTPLADPRRRRQLSVEGGVSPVWTRDGRELFYRRLRKVIHSPLEN